MNYFVKFILIILLIYLSACGTTKDKKISEIEEKDLDQQMIEAYQEGLEMLDQKYPLKAAKKI